MVKGVGRQFNPVGKYVVVDKNNKIIEYFRIKMNADLFVERHKNDFMYDYPLKVYELKVFRRLEKQGELK